MKETVIGDAWRARVRVPADVAAAFAETARRVRARSTIVWGEHCTECDYPACYATCAFYTPRADLHCRRFVAGIESLADEPGGARLERIRFRRWGKLEGGGPVAVRPVAGVARAEALDAMAAAALTVAPLPRAVGHRLAQHWNARKVARAAAGGGVSPDAFVIEAWSADGRSHAFTLSVLQGRGSAMFQAPFTVTTEYGRLVIPLPEIRAHVDLARHYLIQIEPVGDADGREVVFGLRDFVAFAGEAPGSVQREATPGTARPAAKVKVVVWDLDDTLWTGTLAEVGPAGVAVRPEAVAAVKALDERGVLQSIASKNHPAEALQALDDLGLASYFLYPQIAWCPKSDSIRRIAAALDLGVESFVFIDDQPFERAEVQAAHPRLRVLSPAAVEHLLADPSLDLPVTPESRRRRSLYRTDATRATAFAQAGTDYLTFLRGCATTLDVAPLTTSDVDRVYELSQRTNQLNFTGAKPSRDAIAALVADPARCCLTLRCADRFGDYGLVGFAVLDPEAGEVVEFFMSCRVQRKRVEHAFFALVARSLGAAGHVTTRVHFRRTDRNARAAEMLRELGFAENGERRWSRATAQPFPDADAVRARMSAECTWTLAHETR